MTIFGNNAPRILTPERISEIETFIRNLPLGITEPQKALRLAQQFGEDISLYLNQTNPEIINRIPLGQNPPAERPARNYLVDFVDPAIPPTQHFSEVDQAPEIRPDPNNPGQFIRVERE